MTSLLVQCLRNIHVLTESAHIYTKVHAVSIAQRSTPLIEDCKDGTMIY